MDIKEKIKLFNNLRNPQFAEIDMDMLVKNNPAHSEIMRFGRNPKRCADDILYSLLDVCKPDEIINNRKTNTNDIVVEEHDDGDNIQNGGDENKGTDTSTDATGEGATGTDEITIDDNKDVSIEPDKAKESPEGTSDKTEPETLSAKVDAEVEISNNNSIPEQKNVEESKKK